MALEIAARVALLRIALVETLKAVIDAKKQDSKFYFVLTHLESTLLSITPRVDEISRINQKLDRQTAAVDKEMKDLVALLKDGEALVQKCSKISSINLYRKRQYYKELVDLDHSILRYFFIILPLDHFRDNKEILFLVKELHTKLVGDDNKREEIEESDKPKEGFGVGMSKTMKVHQDSEKEQAMKVDKDTKKEEPGKSYSKNVESKLQPGKAFQEEGMKKFFLLEGCPCNVDLDILLTSEAKVLGKGTYKASYKCNTESAVILVVKRLRGEVKFGETEFKQRIEHLGKIGQHPNIIPMFGYYYSKDQQILLYDYAPAGSFFDEFLMDMKQSKRKNIRQERKKISTQNLTMKRLGGDEITAKHWDSFYNFYRNTTDNKWGTAYLTRDFFHNMGSKMGDQVLLVIAEDGDELVAGALNLIGGDTLFGRLWGCHPQVHFPSLHFEACYYQAIEAAIELNLDKVEAGAQGEHKIQRGYLPVTTYSCHYILDETFRKVLEDFLVRETTQVNLVTKMLQESGPFKDGLE